MDRTDDLPSLHTEETDRGTYLARCQVDTPERLLRFVWTQVNSRRPNAGNVVDFGCGDARFSSFGTFDTYTGFEIDPARGPRAPLRSPNKVILGDAFEPSQALGFSTCVGNPPYVRHHDLEEDWLERADKRLKDLMPYQADGRSNAYVHFMWLALASVDAHGLVALVIPFEWVSRPASAKLRSFIKKQGWDVDVFHIRNAAFERVLTTACVAVIDKRAPLGGKWQFFDVDDADVITSMKEVTGSSHKQLAYQKAAGQTRAIRGLSPGGKEVFVLTEAERIRFQLEHPRDVLPAVSSFRHLEQSQMTLTETLFRNHFVHTGKRCWLLNVDGEISLALKAYLDQVPKEARVNYTCRSRKLWWKFVMPKVADILYSSGFKTARPKMFRNVLGAIHVGSIHGIHCEAAGDAPAVMAELQKIDLSKKVVSLANGFLKVEVRQMNTVLNDVQKRLSTQA